MKNKFGNFCMILGAALLIGALSLFGYNQHEAAKAERATVDLLPQLLAQIEQNRQEQAAAPESETQPALQPEGTPIDFLNPSAFEMTEVEIDGYGYIGYLSIPAMELELPIMADWDYKRLNIAPCRYTGSVRGEDLVLMAIEAERGRYGELYRYGRRRNQL